MTNQGYFSNINAIVETSNFSVFVPRCPHVDRNDGGHICIATNKNDKYTIFDLNEEELFELSILTKEAGKALFDVTNERGIDVKLINYQINGNWSFGTKERAPLHVHLYGRAASSRIQTFGQSLYFPEKKSNANFYENNEPFNKDDLLMMRTRISENIKQYSQICVKLNIKNMTTCDLPSA